MRENHEIKNHLYDGQTIIISSKNNENIPRKLIKEIRESEVNDLTLIIFKINEMGQNDENDPISIIKNQQVRKLITTDLGELKDSYNDYVDQIEIIPEDIYQFKVDAAAKKLPGNGGFYIDKKYAENYRKDYKDYLETHSFKLPNDREVILEDPFEPDISIISVDYLDVENFNFGFNNENRKYRDELISVAKSGNRSFIEYRKAFTDNNTMEDGNFIFGVLENNNEI